MHYGKNKVFDFIMNIIGLFIVGISMIGLVVIIFISSVCDLIDEFIFNGKIKC